MTAKKHSTTEKPALPAQPAGAASLPKKPTDQQAINIAARQVASATKVDIYNMLRIYDGLYAISELLFDNLGDSEPEHPITDFQKAGLIQASRGLVELLGHSITGVDGALHYAGNVLEDLLSTKEK
jgi:hypothetical protein